MNIKLRKQYSKGYQVIEIELDGVPKEKIKEANSWMDEIGLAEVNKMADNVANNTTPAPVKPAAPTIVSPKAPFRQNNEDDPATPSQIKYLNQYNVEYDPSTITKKEASELLDKAFAQANAAKAGKSKPSTGTVKQAEVVLTDDDLPF